MIRHDDMRARRDPQAPIHFHTGFVEHLNFIEQYLRVNDYTAADQPRCILRENAGWHQVNLERPKLIDNRMSRIIPAIEPRHIIHALGEIIHDLTLTLVTPLRTDHCCYCHYASEF